MFKKYGFYIALIIIYILFLTKDTLIKVYDNRSDINEFVKNSSSDYYKEEYERLVETLNLTSSSYNLIYSKIIMRDIYEFYNKITIAKGLNDDIKEGDLVVNENGLVGIINKVYKNSSEVTLITNKETNISVKINDAYGILYSSDNKLFVKNVKSNKKLSVGDKVYTSGLTDIPEGIIIGEVKEIIITNLELEYLIEVSSFNNFNTIKYVGVLSL